jgi:two-component system, NarL family, sensor kinase
VSAFYETTLLMDPASGRLAPRRAAPRPARLTQGALERLLQSLEARQHRHAAFLHDHVLQDLYGLRLEAARPRNDAGDGLEGQLETLADRVRGLTDDLMPPSLRDYGLAEALRSHVARWEPALHVRLHAGAAPDQPGPADLYLLRIVQEALANVVAHADTGRASVHLLQDDYTCTLRVCDEGRGFEVPRSYRRFTATGRFGLFRARAYARAAGGRLSVVSAPEAGTVLSVRVPTFAGAD